MKTTFTVVPLSIPNDRGMRLSGQMYKPDIDGKLSCVLMFNGFTGYHEENNFTDVAQRLSGEGIVTVRFTPTGFGASEGSLENDYRFSQNRSDAQSVYSYLSHQSFVDMSRIGIFGVSLGGKLAVLFVSDHPEIKAMCILSAPVSLLGSSYGKSKEEWKSKGFFERVSGRDKKIIRIPYAYVDDEEDERHNIVDAIKKIGPLPKFIVAGDADDTVPWQDTHKIFQSLPEPKEFLLLPGVGHWYKRNDSLLPRVHDPIVAFFVKNL